MFGIYELSRLAHAEHREQVRKWTQHDVEGATVYVPNLIDRILQAFHAARANRSYVARQSKKHLTPNKAFGN